MATTQRGIQIQGSGQVKLVSDLPIPKVRDDHILVKVVAVALNPADFALIRLVNEKGPLSGCDYAGVVEEVGSAVTNGLKPGDRVAGWTHGGGGSAISSALVLPFFRQNLMLKNTYYHEQPMNITMKVVLLRNISLRMVIFKSGFLTKSPLKRLRPSELASLLLAKHSIRV